MREHFGAVLGLASHTSSYIALLDTLWGVLDQDRELKCLGAREELRRR